MEHKSNKVPEKYLRRRRIALLIIIAIVVAIIALIFIFKKPKSTKANPGLDSSPSQNESQSDQETDKDKSSKDDDKRSAGGTLSQEEEKDSKPKTLETSGESLEDLVDTLEAESPEGNDEELPKDAEEDNPEVRLSRMAMTVDVSPNKAPSSTEQAKEAAAKKKTQSKDWRLLVVSGATPLAEEYTVETVEVGGQPVDQRIEEPLVKMILAAKADGINLQIVSGYRSVERQREIYNEKMKEYDGMGLSKERATEYTEMYIATPGESEHHTGLAVDILTPSYTKMLPAYENTVAAKWLKENAATYGFILRYPKNKEKITGITFEPWHYRFVGESVAKEIMEKQITLEEYLYIKETESNKAKTKTAKTTQSPETTGKNLSPETP